MDIESNRAQEIRETLGVDGLPGGRALGTASWLGRDELAGLTFRDRPEHGEPGKTPYDIWIGEDLLDRDHWLGFNDDRHVCLVSGTRGGKGTSVIIPNLCLWQGSCIVVDPKGENAAVTAARRGKGSEYAEGLGQRVHILDPFETVDVPGVQRSSFNPLNLAKPDNPLAIVNAGRIASAIVVRGNSHDPMWDEAAYALIKSCILFVASHEDFKNDCNLTMVWRLLSQGAAAQLEMFQSANNESVQTKPNGQPITAFDLLWTMMKGVGRASAIALVISGTGVEMEAMAEQTRTGILKHVATQLEFLSSPQMQSVLDRSDFALAELKSSPTTVYLCLPRRFMSDHFRWLRMIIDLTIGELEQAKSPRKIPTLFVLDEFAGLKRMEVIEHAAAQGAGFGVKFLFVIQNLPQLIEVYGRSWETFLSNCGLLLFFQIDDESTRTHVSGRIGNAESHRRAMTKSDSGGKSETNNNSKTITEGTTNNTSDATTKGETDSYGYSTSRSQGYASTEGTRSSVSKSRTHGFMPFSGNRSSGTQTNKSFSDTSSTNQSWSDNRGISTSSSVTRTEGDSTSKSTADMTGSSETKTSGWSEGWNDTVHVRALLTPDELGLCFSRVKFPPEFEREKFLYPGLMLALIAGKRPLAARRVNYFEAPYFLGKFDPHPDHEDKNLLTIAERKRREQDRIALEQAQIEQLKRLRDEEDRTEQQRLRRQKQIKLSQRAILALSVVGLLAVGVGPLYRMCVGLSSSLLTRLPGGLSTDVHAAKSGLIVGAQAVPLRGGNEKNNRNTTEPGLSPFDQGLADRRNWEMWFAATDGAYQQGAEFWAGERSRPHPTPCHGQSAFADSDKATWEAGCLAAQSRLEPSDKRRKADPDYRRGWNSYH